MIELTFSQLQLWIATLLWPFVRIAAFVQVAPLLGHTSIPAPVKIGIVSVITLVTVVSAPAVPDIPILSWAGVGIIVEQMIIGVGMALGMHIMFAAVQVAGEFIGLQMGLAFASFFSPDTGANTMVISQWLYMISLLLFISLDGHLLMIQVLAESFQSMPIGIAGLSTDGFRLMLQFSSIFFVSGLLLALPLVICLLIINLTLGILNRAAPQFTVFSVGFPMSLLTGIILLMVLMTDIAGFLQGLYAQGLGFMRDFAAALNPGP